MGITSKGNMAKDMANNLQEFEKFVNNELMDEVESGLNELVADSFENEKYQGKRSKKWQSRKKDREKRTRRKTRKGILIDSGDLAKSYETEQRIDEVSIGSDLVYAEVHNEGGRAGRGAGFDMPKRQHAPIEGEEIPELQKDIDKLMDDEMDRIFD